MLRRLCLFPLTAGLSIGKASRNLQARSGPSRTHPAGGGLRYIRAMSHCPQCGKATPPEGSVACPFCGTRLAAAIQAPKPAARTMVGVSLQDLAPKPLAPAPAREPALAAGAPSKANRTIVGMPASALQPDRLQGLAQTQIIGSPPASNRTIVGLPEGSVGSGGPPLGASPRMGGLVQAGPQAGATLLGVARPGIAPLRPGEAPEPEDLQESDAPTQAYLREPEPGEEAPYGYQAANELGATVGPSAMGRRPAVLQQPVWQGGKRRMLLDPPRGGAVPRKKVVDASTKRALAVVAAAGALAIVAVLVAVFWPSAPPLSARARADAEGREGVELRCPSCPDGTKVSIGAASATMAASAALVPLPTALSLGENRMKVAVDRPGRGRDETLGIIVNVAYRIRPDLTALQGEHPSIQIVADAAAGTSVSINGHALPLAGGRAVENLDVTEACTGLTGEAKTLSRQIPYAVTPDGGNVENGVVNISVGIVPLQLEAPGPHVIIEGASFVLAGRTMKGAEVLAAGRPIAVRPDGTFAQVMNVSSIGATQIEVRARLAGLAPRLAQIKVRRVESLEAAAREFMAEGPIGYGALAGNITGQVGKAVALTGEVTDTKKQGYETVMLLDVPQAQGCSTAGAFTVRLVLGAESPVNKGDTLRVYGHVARAVALPGRADVPEIEVDFALGAGGKGSTAAPRGGK